MVSAEYISKLCKEMKSEKELLLSEILLEIKDTKDSYGFYITCDYEVLYTFPGKRAKINRKLIKQATSLSDKFNGFDCSSLAEEASDHLCNRYHL
jgi:hypothetical protein